MCSLFTLLNLKPFPPCNLQQFSAGLQDGRLWKAPRNNVSLDVLGGSMHRRLLCFTRSLFFFHNVQWSKTAGTKVHVLQPAAASKILHWWIFASKTVSTCCNHLRMPKAGVLALSREAAANAVAAEAFLMRCGSDSFAESQRKRQTSEHDTEMGFLHIFCHVLNLVSLSSVHCVSWKILDYTHPSFRTDSLQCCMLLQITAQDFAVDSRPIVAAWSVYQKGRNLGMVFQDQPSSQVWALFWNGDHRVMFHDFRCGDDVVPKKFS